MTGTQSSEAVGKGGAWIWRLVAVGFVLTLIWLGLSTALVFLLVGVFKFQISSVAAPALGFGVMGLMASALHQAARRRRLPGKSAEQIAAEEFLGGVSREN